MFVCVSMLTRLAQIITAYTETCNLACINLLTNSDRTPKTRSVWPTLGSKLPAERMGVNRYFQASWALQPMFVLVIYKCRKQQVSTYNLTELNYSVNLLYTRNFLFIQRPIRIFFSALSQLRTVAPSTTRAVVGHCV